jgi:hypothetical protein
MAMQAMKLCSRCGHVKPTSEFLLDNSSKDGLAYRCKECARAHHREWSAKNRERINAKNRESYHKDVEASREYGKAKALRLRTENREHYREADSRRYWKDPQAAREVEASYRNKNREAVNDKARRYYSRNREVCGERKRSYCERNPEKVRDTKRRYTEANRQKVRDYHREYLRRKLKTDVNYALACRVRTRINAALKEGTSKKAHSMQLLGCSAEQYRAYLEGQFRRGMTWGKVMDGKVHIDHRTPCSVFNLQDITEQKQCFHCTNTRPMWPSENMSKNDSLDERCMYAIPCF